MEDRKILLGEKDIPKSWYNVHPDLPSPLPPPLNPGTGCPLGPEDLAPIFPMELIQQEMSMESRIDIPDEVLEVLKLWRPTPLRRASNLEKHLGTPARIYLKDESVSPAGSHKPNTAAAQAYYNKKEGVKRICTETGAGQWGSALSLACCLLGIECTVYMVKVSYEQKPYRKMLMHAWGAEVFPSPTDRTNSGRGVLSEFPDSPGSLGIAISEAVEDAASNEDAKYSLGSVLNHVLLHQTVIGLEIKEQLKIAGEKCDIMTGCVGGGSNFAGACFPFVREKLAGDDIEFIACEPRACPTLTRGEYKYDFGDTSELTPLIKMYTLGHKFVPPPIHSGGLRYHGMAPLFSALTDSGVIARRSYHQNEVFEAAVAFARVEGMLCAPETSHCIKAGMDEALKCRETGEEKCIVITYSGHGFFDLASYEKYLAGELTDFEHPDEEMKKSLESIPETGNK